MGKALFLTAAFVYVLFIVINGNTNRQKEPAVSPQKNCFIVGEDVTGTARETCYDADDYYGHTEDGY